MFNIAVSGTSVCLFVVIVSAVLDTDSAMFVFSVKAH